ncbi:hypothetical protein AHAS_Ahas17G0093200 [Arachis hypogaea]
MVNEKESLWEQVLYNKYGRGQDLQKSLICKSTDSTLWKSLTKMWDVTNLDMVVIEATNQTGEWNMNWLHRHLPEETINHIQAIHPPNEDLGEDKAL